MVSKTTTDWRINQVCASKSKAHGNNMTSPVVARNRPSDGPAVAKIGNYLMPANISYKYERAEI